MKKEIFELGDCAKLKSGGPVMTVVWIGQDDDTSIQCRWFDGTKLKEGSFIPESLRHDEAA